MTAATQVSRAGRVGGATGGGGATGIGAWPRGMWRFKPGFPRAHWLTWPKSDVWTPVWPDAAAGRSSELRPARAGLSHNCLGRRRFSSAQLKLFSFPGWLGRKGSLRRKLEEVGESRSSFRPSHPRNEERFLLITVISSQEIISCRQLKTRNSKLGPCPLRGTPYRPRSYLVYE